MPVSVLAAALACCIALPFEVSARRRGNEPPAWREEARKVPDTRFPERFIDSLKNAHEVDSVRGLRTIDTPLPLREEKLVYEAAWGPLKAGYGIMTHKPDTGSDLLRISVKAFTNKFVSALYPVRDFVCSTVDAQGLYPLFFEEHIEEGRYRAKRWALYNHRDEVVHSNKKKRRRVESPRFAQDFLSLLYVVRARELAPGDTFSVVCYVHGKNYPIHVRCGSREKVKIDLGTFKCIKVHPQMVGKGRTFSEGDKLTIWLTDDKRHIPVMIKSKIKLGSIVGRLIYYE